MARKSTHSSENRVLTSLLRKFREDANLTQLQMARSLKMSQSAISKIERGEIRMDLIQLRRWCKVVGIGLVEFAAAFERGAPERSSSKFGS